MRVVVSIVGRDRPGIVAAVAEVLFHCGCNIEDSTNTYLAGEFAMILIVSMPDGLSPEDFRRRFHDIEHTMGLFISLKTLHEEAIQASPSSRFVPYTISVYGSDRPGIVYRITQELARHGINVTDLDTKVVGEKGRPVYVMVLEMDVPSGLDFDPIVAGLRRIAAELSVELSVNSAEALPL